MKKISLIGRCHLQKKAFLILPALFLTQSAMGVVTAHIVEEGTDVRVSFSGSIRLDPNLATATMPISLLNIGVTPSALVVANFAEPWFLGNNVGFAVASTLNAAATNFLFIGSSSFGFADSGLIWAGSDISDGVVGAVSEITVDPSDSFFVIGNTRLADVLGATTGDGDTLWTAINTNDTIVLSTSAPVIVPEPSSAILCFFAGIGLLRRKR